MDKGIYLANESAMIFVYDGIYLYIFVTYAFGEYRNAFKSFFKNESKDRKTLYTDTISGKKRDELIIRQYYNMSRFDKLVNLI